MQNWWREQGGGWSGKSRCQGLQAGGKPQDSARALSEGREDTPSVCYRVQASAGQNTNKAGCGRYPPLLLGHRQPKVEVWLEAGDPWESGQGSSPTVEYFPCWSFHSGASWVHHHPGVSFQLRGIMLEYSEGKSK